MFFRLLNIDPNKSTSLNEEEVNRVQNLFSLHPLQISAIIELFWELRQKGTSEVSTYGHPYLRSILNAVPMNVLRAVMPAEFISVLSGSSDTNILRDDRILWDHLIYAYMVENTKIYEVFRKAMEELICSENLGVPTIPTQLYIRNTEMLFYSDPPAFSIYNLKSSIRPDTDGFRRSIYYRMFGMDLNHGKLDGTPYIYKKPTASNHEFVTTLENFLREVWRGIINESNTSGAKSTDDGTIANHAEKLHDMLMTRRKHGNISREEFCYVAMMSWFHLTILFDSSFVMDLRAEASGIDDRLKKVAEKVGIPVPKKLKELFRLSTYLSHLLIRIETGEFNEPSAVPALYTSGSLIESEVRQIIADWSTLTGRNLKEGISAATRVSQHRVVTNLVTQN